MAEKKPNIIECDGLIIRGPDGKKRAEIAVTGNKDTGQVVEFDLYGDDEMDIPEPAFSLSVDGKGQVHFWLGYAGSDKDGALLQRTAVSLFGGNEDQPPRIAYFGRRDQFYCAPTLVLSGERMARRSDFVAAVLEAAREFSTRYGVDEEDPIELMGDVAAVLQFEQEAATS